ncbi:MAG TPA: hypothetical protein VFA20_16160 [Myxococcaceae bacterium]|nr:hypothetical protein [Myxococcaceae bacterium]
MASIRTAAAPVQTSDRSNGLTLPVGRRAEAAKSAPAQRNPVTDRFNGGPGSKPAPLSLAPAAGKPLASPPALPSWYPQNFDLAAAGEGVKGVLEAQGQAASDIGSGQVHRLVFSDGDGTLLATKEPIYLKNKATGQYLTYPGTSDLVMLPGATSRDTAAGMAELKKKYPDLPLDQYAMDFSEYGSMAALLRTGAVKPMLDRFQTVDKDPTSRDFVITARSDAAVVPAMKQWTSDRGVDLNGTFVTSNPELGKALHFTDAPFTSGQKKAVGMAAAIQAYGPENIQSLEFHDDGDDNLAASMQLLPKLYPNIDFKFYDSISKGSFEFEPRLIAHSEGGKLVADGWGSGATPGAALTDEQVAAYGSTDDLPVPVDPRLTDAHPTW